MFGLSLRDCLGHVQCNVSGPFDGVTHYSEPGQMFFALIKESLGWS